MQIVIRPNPTVIATTTEPSCTGSTPNSDGKITLSSFTTEKYDMVTGSTYTGSATYASASAIPSGGVITNTLVNPASSQDYTIRIFNSNNCFIDRTVTMASVSCCPAQTCLPVTITIRRGSANE